MTRHKCKCRRCTQVGGRCKYTNCRAWTIYNCPGCKRWLCKDHGQWVTSDLWGCKLCIERGILKKGKP